MKYDTMNKHIGSDQITVGLLTIVPFCSIVFEAFLPVLWSYTTMIHIPFFCFCLTAGLTVSFSLRSLDKRLNCNQQVRIQSIVDDKKTRISASAN